MSFICNLKFFDVNVKIMRVLGVWHDASANFLKTKVFFAVHVFLSLIFIALEITFIFTKVHYVERLKTVGIATFHILCVIKMFNAIRVDKDLQTALKIVTRKTMTAKNFCFDENLEDIERAFNNYETKANILCLLMLAGFVGISQTSLVVSYISVLAKTFYTNDLNTTRTAPYNHYPLLDWSDQKSFVLEAAAQGYFIMYMTFNFVCKFPIQKIMQVIYLGALQA